jgi:2-oxoglutarate dehydrogenase E1 component
MQNDWKLDPARGRVYSSIGRARSGGATRRRDAAAADRPPGLVMAETYRPNSLSLGFAESVYAEYLRDPASVPQDWRRYFENIARGERSAPGVRLGPSFRPRSLFNPPTNGHDHDGESFRRHAEVARFQDRVDQLVRAYRVRGHRIAAVDPLGMPRPHMPELDLDFYGLTEADLDRPVSSDTISGEEVHTLREVIRLLRNTYCRSIGVQFMHMDDLPVRRWLQEWMEATQNRMPLGRDEQLRILTRLTDAVIFEEFIQRKYIGAKSFSLEGAESLIPLLDLAIEKAGDQGLDEIVLGMAHRGRLNVLANIMGKSPAEIFREFEDKDPRLHLGSGDVKYHLGYSTDWMTASGRKVHLSLCFNPSHLESVNPVVLGKTRAKQDRAGDTDRARKIALLIHGDASFAGEGVVQETLNLSELAAYTTGGTLHVVVNNQLGFTTPPSEGRSSTYATDVAKMLQIPIFHVNGEDPEAVAQCVRLAMDFRLAFHRDVVIDMYSYRRHGHNESDEPSFTQPVMYRAIEKRPSVRDGYLEHLLKLEGITREEADHIARERRERLERELAVARSADYVPHPQTFGGLWSGYYAGRERPDDEVDTGVERERLSQLLEVQTRFPDEFHPHPKIEKGIRLRREMAQGNRPLDWAAAESLAFATLATSGHRIRLTGQDSARGTFSQRHATLHDVEDGHTYVPLQHLTRDQAPVEICNSPLSEAGVLGFEYGYSLDCPEGLVMWEAQFGDFANGAQVFIDVFLAAAEARWQRASGLVLLLPHAYEGQGPEHSSARLERFLSLAAEDNIQVVNPTTPAQYFHVLRRQVLRRWRKPLVVMTPKSLLRHPKAVSSLEDCGARGFLRVIPDAAAEARAREGRIGRILLCSGKIYYELDKRREELKRDDVAIVRLEQLYPVPKQALRSALAAYADETRVVWVQEEPENMGAWTFMRMHFGERLFDRFPFSHVSRPADASPATGSHSSHKLEQENLLTRVFEARKGDE